MAVVSVIETHQDRDGERTTDGGRLRRTFIVRTSAVGDSLVTVLNAAGIPVLYSSYTNGTESASNWILKRKSPRQDPNSPLVWFVDCEYEPREDADDDEPNPVQRPTKYTWRTVQDVREVVVDAYSVKVQNSAGDPFDTAVEADRSYRVLIVERNESTFSPLALDAYVNTLNQSPIFGYAAKEGRIVAIDGTSEYDPDYGAYFSVSYEIHFRDSTTWVPTISSSKLMPDGTYPSGVTAVTSIGPWDTTRRNVGFQYKKTSAGTVLIEAKDAEGLQAAAPVDLNANGTKRTDLGDPIYLVVRPYLPKNWSPLSLD